MLAIANIICGFLAATSQVPISRLELGSLLMLVARVLTDLIFAVAVLQSNRSLPRRARAPIAMVTATGAFLVMVIATSILFWIGSGPPDWISSKALASL